MSLPRKRMRPPRGFSMPAIVRIRLGLAGAVCADDRDQFAFRDGQRNAVKRLRVAVEEIEIFDLRGSQRLLAEIGLEHGRIVRDFVGRAGSNHLAVVQHHDRARNAITARMTCSISRMVRPVLSIEFAAKARPWGRSRSAEDRPSPRRARGCAGSVASARATSSRLRSGSVSDAAG